MTTEGLAAAIIAIVCAAVGALLQLRAPPWDRGFPESRKRSGSRANSRRWRPQA
jgi:hypothetical protein